MPIVESFKITCVTCQAALSVRNQALLGQIVACPRCGSMVEVALPAAASAAEVAVARPAAAAPSSGSPAGESAGAESPSADSAAAGPSVPAPLQPGSEAALPRAAATLSEASAEALQAGAAVARYQWIVWSVASFFMGAALVGFVLLTRGDSSAEATAPAPSDMIAGDARLSVDPIPLVTDRPLPDKTVVAAPQLAEAAATGAPGGAVPTPATEENADTQPVDEPSPPPEPTTLVRSQPDPVPTGLPEPAAGRAGRLDRRGSDPLDWDPEDLTLATIDQPAIPPTRQPNSDVPPPPPAPDSLSAQGFSAQGLPADDPSAMRESSAEIASTAPLVRRGPNTAPPGAAAASDRDAAEHLAQLIPALKIDQLPLVDCLRLFSQLSGVPISVAPQQLLMAGITPRHSVSLQASGLSLGAMLTQVLEPLRLEYQTRGAQVVVVRQGATKIREINYPVDDLLAASTSAEQLAEWVEQLVAPATWQAGGGKGRLETTAGRLQIVQTQQVQYQVLILLERLRTARKLPPQSRYPVEQLAGTPANLLLREKLAEPTTFTFSRYTALDDIFVYWQVELGVPLLIDWPALAAAELWPDSAIACAIIDRPWGIALENVLEPLGLGWRAAPGGAIEITSAEKVQNELQLELYALRTNAKSSGPELVAALDSLVKPPAGQASIVYDATGSALLVLQPAARQRQVGQHLREIGMLRSE